MKNPMSMCRASISFCLIVIQLSVVSGALNNVEQIQSRSDPSSPLSLFPAPDDSGFTGNLDLSSSEDLMIPFNNNGEDFELASVDKNCASGPKRRGKRRARRGEQTSCPNNLQFINPPNKPQKAGQQPGASQRQTTPPKLQQDPPKIPGSEDPEPMPPILLEQLGVPKPDPTICPWGIASIPICAKAEDADDSKDILPGMGFISDFMDIVHWNRYDPANGCQEPGETLYCCHWVTPEPILQHPREGDVPEADLSSPLRPFDGWFPSDPNPPDPQAAERQRARDYTATLCRPGPTPDYPGPERIIPLPNH